LPQLGKLQQPQPAYQQELNIATADPASVQRFLDQALLPDLDKSVKLKQPFPKKWRITSWSVAGHP
jgi:hypothetical protein